jgi:hypothetical protein
MARGAAGGVPPSSPRHTRGYETRFIGAAHGAGGCGGCPPIFPSPHARL